MDKISKNLAETTIKMLGDRWKVQIIDALMDGTKRFGELKRELGDITQKVLTSNLRMLEENGIIIRHVYAEIPPRVDYTLTAIGYNLKPVIDSMVAWAEEYRELLIQEFKDMDLIGIPKRIVVGKKAADGIIEFKERRSSDVQEISVNEVSKFM